MTAHPDADVDLTAMLAVVACPEDQQTLAVAPKALIERLNALIGDRALRDRSGNLVGEPLDAGLVRADGQRLYAVRDGLAVLLIEEGIALDDDDRALLAG